MEQPDIRTLILRSLKKKKQITAAEIVEQTGFSRAYVNRFFRELRNEGKIVLLGKANSAKYVLAQKKAIAEAKKELLGFNKEFDNKNISEDIVLDEIKRNTGIFLGMILSFEIAARSFSSVREFGLSDTCI